MQVRILHATHDPKDYDSRSTLTTQSDRARFTRSCIQDYVSDRLGPSIFREATLITVEFPEEGKSKRLMVTVLMDLETVS